MTLAHRKHVRFCLIGLILGMANGPLSAFGQVTCQSEVSFSVKKGEAEQEVVFRREEARGPSEDEVKSALEKKLLESRHEALTACRERHENMSGCVASKYSSLGGLMQQMQFAARSKLEEAIEADCKAQQGTCIEGKASTPTCVVPTPVPTAEAEPAAEKDAGKKGGKK